MRRCSKCFICGRLSCIAWLLHRWVVSSKRREELRQVRGMRGLGLRELASKEMARLIHQNPQMEATF